MNDTPPSRESIRYELIAEPDPANTGMPTLASIHRRLRGRYPLVAFAATALAGGFAFGAFHVTKPEFESRGLVRIDPVAATTMHDPEMIPVPSIMSAYVTEQSMLVTSRQVLEQAADDPALAAVGWPRGDAGLTALDATVSAQTLKGQNIVDVAARSTDPTQAKAAVDAVLRAYQDHAGTPAAYERNARRQAIELRRREIVDRLATLETELIQATDAYGPEVVERLHVQRVEELITLERRITEIASREAALASGGDPSQVQDIPGIGPGAIDASAESVGRLQAQIDDLVSRRATLAARFEEGHPVMRDLDADLETARVRLQLERASLAAQADVHPTIIDTTLTGALDPAIAAVLAGSAGPTSERLTALRTRYETRIETLRTEIAALSRQRVAVDNIRDRIDDARLRLGELDRRAETLAAAANAPAVGVTIANWGDLPMVPVRDRRAQLAVAAGLGGAGLGVLLVLLGATIDPRVRYASDLRQVPNAPAVAGMIPEMHGHADDAARATRGIHQLRAMIELRADGPQDNVVVITSCGRGEGRTSVARALGTALARSGRRTLLVDADLGRSRLSHEMGMDALPGLVEALGIDPEEGQVHETREPGLWLLPIGMDDVPREELLSRPRLQWLIERLRSSFDTIVIDTGPALASAEGPTLAALADHTVLVVEREQRLGSVRDALARLQQVSAQVVGVVLNRASDADFRELEIGSAPARQGKARRLVEPRTSTFAPTGTQQAAAVRGRAGSRRATPRRSRGRADRIPVGTGADRGFDGFDPHDDGHHAPDAFSATTNGRERTID